MFRFLDGDPARTMKLMDHGGLPWWTVPEAKGSFWRPVTILTHWLDYRLWPNAAWLMHLHSVAWYGLLVLGAAALYRRMMGAGVAAGLALVLFAIDDAHAMPAAWLANRNAMVSAVFGIVAVLAHIHWRRDGRTTAGGVALLCTTLSLLSAEAGVGTFAYLAAYAACLERGKWYKRAATLAPYIMILIVWRIVWTIGNHGVQHLGLYIDPVSEPGPFVLGLIQRVPLLMLGQWAMPPAEIAIILSNPLVLALQIAGVAITAVVAAAFAPLIRRDPVARFWALGMVLSLVPICASFPANRLLSYVGIGAFGLLAQFLAAVLRLGNGAHLDLSGYRPRRVLGWSLVVMHLFLAPLGMMMSAAYPTGFQRLTDQLTVRTALDPAVETQDLIIVNAPSVMHAMYLSVQRELAGQPVPRHTRVLAPALPAISVHRTDERTLVIRPEKSFIAWEFDHLFRSKRRPMSVGQRVRLTGLTIEVTKLTPDLRPAEAVFQFAVPLEDRSLRWLEWKDGEFVSFTPPRIGETIELRPKRPALW